MSKPTQPQNTQHPFDQLKQREVSAQAKKLAKHPFWWLSKKGDADKTVLFDAQSKLLWQLLPEDPAEKETHAILGRDFRTLTQGVERWNVTGNDKSESSLTTILTGWHIANKTQTIAVCKLAHFNTRQLVSSDGYTWQTRHNGDNAGNAGDKNGNLISQNNQIATAGHGNACVLLAKNGVENLPISTDMSDAIVRKKDFNYLNSMTFSGWKLPSEQILKDLVLSKNPYRSGEGLALQNWAYWRCDNGNLIIRADEKGKPVLTNEDAVNARELVINTAWQSKTPEQIALEMLEKGWVLTAHDATDSIAPSNIMTQLTEMDYRSVRLPKLEDDQFSDINKGIWEFWGMDSALLKAEGIYARDPAKDLKKHTIGIDFGTSSTVVAVDNNGQHGLFRIGVRDFYETVKSSHYENPTVLEFVDFQNFISAWDSKAYRPEVSWDDMRCSHEAQHNFRNNDGNAQIVGSIFVKMKQWAMRNHEQKQKIIDQAKRYEFELPALEQRKGQVLTAEKRPFDPIEVYAWFLGMTINWRGRGEIYTKYYMTFPVAYPKEVKEKILSSFRRGLMRAMPETLAVQDAFKKEFLLEELATEPAAYAASALDALNIQPTAEGVAYGVFDFGGGTTDFDYGYYRYATEAEEDQGYEKILEHIDAQGDRFLGGENLLENMAYLVFQHNLPICAKQKIAFDKPLDAKTFAGSEAFLTKTQAARTNTIMLMAKLRAFWESGQYNNATGTETVDFLNASAEKTPCDFAIPVDDLNSYLTARIEEGIYNFFMGAKSAFDGEMPKTLYLLLAGNSSRSKWVSEFFGLSKKEDKANNEKLQQLQQTIFAGKAPSKIIVKAPLPIDDKAPEKPTAKTGVALGLLKLAPGGSIGLVNKTSHENHGEAPFGHFVGRLRQGKLSVVLQRGHAYHQWHELAPINRSVVNLYHSQQPRALSGEMAEGDPEMTKVRIDFAGHTEGHKAFIRATKPNEIEICSAPDKATADAGKGDNLQEVGLG